MQMQKITLAHTRFYKEFEGNQNRITVTLTQCKVIIKNHFSSVSPNVLLKHKA